MFKYGDTVYVLNSSAKNGDKIKILKKQFECYTNNDHTSMEVMGTKHILPIQSWAVFPTVEKATQFAIAYLINTHEFKKSINKDINGDELYKDLELNHSELILKYIDHVFEDFTED